MSPKELREQYERSYAEASERGDGRGALAALIAGGLTKTVERAMEQAKPELERRAERRGAWLDRVCAERGIGSDYELSLQKGAPRRNTIDRYRSGKTSQQDRQVRLKLAKALNVDFSEVPE
jgi:hypothetical protein